MEKMLPTVKEHYDAELAKKDAELSEALDRIGDMLEADDGQAYKEAERFYKKYRPVTGG